MNEIPHLNLLDIRAAKDAYDDDIIWGLSYEDSNDPEGRYEWVATSKEYGQFHCHGIGNTARAAISDMRQQWDEFMEKRKSE